MNLDVASAPGTLIITAHTIAISHASKITCLEFQERSLAEACVLAFVMVCLDEQCFRRDCARTSCNLSSGLYFEIFRVLESHWFQVPATLDPVSSNPFRNALLCAILLPQFRHFNGHASTALACGTVEHPGREFRFDFSG